MSAATVKPKQMFTKGRKAAADWLAHGEDRVRPYPLNVCRAIRQMDMVQQHEMLPNFPELLNAWEDGFDSTIRAGQQGQADGAASVSSAPPATPVSLSIFETAPAQYPDDLVEDHPEAAPLMRDMNQVATICAGLGTVMRIIAGNVEAQRTFSTAVPGSTPPLSEGAVHDLASLAAAVCDQLTNSVVNRAGAYKSE